MHCTLYTVYVLLTRGFSCRDRHISRILQRRKHCWPAVCVVCLVVKRLSLALLATRQDSFAHKHGDPSSTTARVAFCQQHERRLYGLTDHVRS